MSKEAVRVDIDVVNYGALGHVRPRLPTINLFSSLLSYVYNGQLYPTPYPNTVVTPFQITLRILGTEPPLAWQR